MAVRLRTVLFDLLQGPVSRAVNRALGVLKSFRFTLPEGAGSISIDVERIQGAADSGVLSEDVTDLLVAVGEAAKDRRTGILLAADEVQYLSMDELAAVISAIHRTVQLDLPVVLVGVGVPQLPGLAGEAKSHAGRLFDFPGVDSLDPDYARAVLAIPVAEQGVEFSDDALTRILETTQGYPAVDDA